MYWIRWPVARRCTSCLNVISPSVPERTIVLTEDIEEKALRCGRRDEEED
jgi:hypothetical protein